jgi:hypothetical protein
MNGQEGFCRRTATFFANLANKIFMPAGAVIKGGYSKLPFSHACPIFIDRIKQPYAVFFR